jgi:N-acetylneuraminic acid mutarotase
MKFKTLLILTVLATAFFTSCTTDETEIGNWVQKAYFDGFPRGEGSSFTLNDYGFFGMGKDDNGYLSDFWRYDPVANSWKPAAKFPGAARAYNVSISNGSKAYVGLGYDGNTDLADMWEYDATTDKWTQIADFPGGARYYATAFAIGNDIYVGTGYSKATKKSYNDFWKYSNGAWSVETNAEGKAISTVNSNPGTKRYKASSVGFNGKGYLISGYDNSTLSDFWEYDPSKNTWTKLTSLTDADYGDTGIPRSNGLAFVSEGKLFVACGSNTSGLTNTVYEWDPETTVWTKKTSLESSAREGAGLFVIKDAAYIVGGRSGNSYYDDCFMFQPSLEKDSND